MRITWASERTLPHIAIITAVFLWSSAFVAIRAATTTFSSGGMALLRFLIASVILGMPFMFFRLKLVAPQKADLLKLIFIGIFGVACYSALLNESEKSINSGIACFLLAQTPLISALLAVIFLKEKLSSKIALGIMFSLIGIAMMTVSADVGERPGNEVFLILLAGLLSAIQTIIQKSLLARLSVLHAISYATWLGTLCLCYFWPALVQDMREIDPLSLYAVIYLGVLPSTLGQFMWSYGLSRMKAVHATLYLYLMPFISSFLGFVLLNEKPPALAFSGGMVALIGAFVASFDWVNRKKKSAY